MAMLKPRMGGQMSRPRPRMNGNENPAMTGMDKRPGGPGAHGMHEQGSVLPRKMAQGANKARKGSLRSARSAAAQRMMTRGVDREV